METTIMNQIIDPFNRHITYLRVSVTDDCNYRCHYCRDEDHQTHTSRSEVLSFEEIVKIVRLFVELGVTKCDSQVESLYSEEISSS